MISRDAAIERLRKSPEYKSPEKSREAALQGSRPCGRAAARSDLGPVRGAAALAAADHGVDALVEAYGSGGSSQGNPPYTASVSPNDANRLTPPADIPVPVIAPPLDLRADAVRHLRAAAQDQRRRRDAVERQVDVPLGPAEERHAGLTRPLFPTIVSRRRAPARCARRRRVGASATALV